MQKSVRQNRFILRTILPYGYFFERKKGSNAMKYIFFNIRTLIKYEKFIFAVMLICVFVSAWVMTFSYGLYHNYMEMLNQPDNDIGDSLTPLIADGETLTRGDVTRFFLELSPETLDAMSAGIVVGKTETAKDVFGNTNEISIVSRFVIRNGSFIPSPYAIQSWNDHSTLLSGRYISDIEEANAEKVVILNEEKNGRGLDLRNRIPDLFKDDETILIDGEEFKIIGTHNSFGFVIPLLAMPEDKCISAPSIVFYKSISRNQYADIVNTAEMVLPGKLIFPEPEFVDEQSIFIYNNMLVVSVLIAVIAIINFAFLYSFILRQRSRSLAVMRICGCTKARARLICLGECCLICIPTFLFGMLTYIPFLHNVLGRLFDYIEEAYSVAVYGLLFAIFVAVLLIVMWLLLFRQIRSELTEAYKGG